MSIIMMIIMIIKLIILAVVIVIVDNDKQFLCLEQLIISTRTCEG